RRLKNGASKMSDSEQKPSDQAKESFPICKEETEPLAPDSLGQNGHTTDKATTEEAKRAPAAEEPESHNGDGTSPKVLSHINDVENPELAGKPVTVEAIITTASVSHLVPSKVKISLRTDSVDDD